MNCPVCNVPLTMTDRQGVEIDYCQRCRGVWLDRGELDKIIERSDANFGAARRDEYGEHNQHNQYNQHQQPQDRRYDDDYKRHSSHESSFYPHQQHQQQQHPYKKHKKKESFLSELFDFD